MSNRHNNNNNNRRRGRRHLEGPWRPGMVLPSTTPASPTRATAPVASVSRPVAPAGRPNAAAAAAAVADVPVSPNYRGNLDNPRNLSADIPAGENCATWWTNLREGEREEGGAYRALFDSMRGIGAVSHAVISPRGGGHSGAAAKVEFFERAAVDRLLARWRAGRLRVAGRVPHVALNRIRVAAHSSADPRDPDGPPGSRVLRVGGDPRVVSVENLSAVLAHPKTRVLYGLERAGVVVDDGRRGGARGAEQQQEQRELGVTDGRVYVEVEFRFASYAVQALRARDIFMAYGRRAGLSDLERALWGEVVCYFARDPCE